MNRSDLKESGLDEVFQLIIDIFKPFRRVLSYSSLVLCPLATLLTGAEKMEHIRTILEKGCDPVTKDKYPEK